jgi:signal peptide peptidase-like protein 2B
VNVGDFTQCGGTSIQILFSQFLRALSVAIAVSVAVLWWMFPTSWYRWIVQDVMAVAVTLYILRQVQLPNLQAATALLGLAFLYDVFFVYISPLLFGSNVMVSVASGVGLDDDSPLVTDENYCEKYPDYVDCATTTLPMLIYVPAFLTWDTDDNAILGLGDIVLPGLLLTWAARYDLRRYGSLYTERAGNGYFPMVGMGYAFGLCLAQIAVELFNSGQPALFYVVPCTLGLVLYRAYESDNLGMLWQRLPPMRSIGLLLNEQQRQQIRDGEGSIVGATAVWTNDSRLAGAGAGAGAKNDGDGDGDDDDRSVHSLHGYDLESTRSASDKNTTYF